MPTTLHSVVLNPQGLFAVYQYDGLDQALLQNRVAVVFACQREIAQLPRGVLQQQRAPILDVVAYSPFEACAALTDRLEFPRFVSLVLSRT